MASDVDLRFVRLSEKRQVGELVMVLGKLLRITRGATGTKAPWTHLATSASEEERAVWDVMDS